MWENTKQLANQSRENMRGSVNIEENTTVAPHGWSRVRYRRGKMKVETRWKPKMPFYYANFSLPWISSYWETLWFGIQWLDVVRSCPGVGSGEGVMRLRTRSYFRVPDLPVYLFIRWVLYFRVPNLPICLFICGVLYFFLCAHCAWDIVLDVQMILMEWTWQKSIP